jgi:hypothetical protein
MLSEADLKISLDKAPNIESRVQAPHGMIPRPRYQASHVIGGDVGVATDPTSSTHEHRLRRRLVNAYALPASFSWGRGVQGSVDRRPDLCFEAVCNYVDEHRHVSAPTFLPAPLPLLRRKHPAKSQWPGIDCGIALMWLVWS